MVMIGFSGVTCFAAQNKSKPAVSASSATVDLAAPRTSSGTLGNYLVPVISGNVQPVEPNTVSTEVVTVDVSTASLDFSKVDAKDRPILERYIQSVFDALTGKTKKPVPVPSTVIKPLSLTDKQLFNAMHVVALSISDADFEKPREAYGVSFYVRRVALRAFWDTWLDSCVALNGDEKCVTDKILPALKYTQDNKIRFFLIHSISELNGHQVWTKHKPFSVVTRQLVGETMKPYLRHSEYPPSLKSQVYRMWFGTPPTWEEVREELKYLEKDSDFFPECARGGLFLMWDTYRMTPVLDYMFEIFEHPNKYPQYMFNGAFSFFISDSDAFNHDTDASRRARVKKDFQMFVDDKSPIFRTTVGEMAKGILAEISRNEGRGKYKNAYK